MEQDLWEKLRTLIADKIGFQIRFQDIPFFQKKIIDRLKHLKIDSLENYYDLLLQDINPTNDNLKEQYRAIKEWKSLASIITNGESFFFRDRGQFDLLKNTIIPQLIEQKRKLKAEEKSQSLTLKIWSAGCSSGQEVYSLAMLVSELIPDLQDWNISIIGTDINQTFLDLARQGIYKQWSFRLTDSLFKQKYFISDGKSWQVKPHLKKMVKFYQDNLLETTKISHYTYDLDLVLCRNVFIYFNLEAITKTITKISHTLSPGGFFLPGHAELQAVKLDDFKILSFPDSLIYQYLGCNFSLDDNEASNILESLSMLDRDSTIGMELVNAKKILSSPQLKQSSLSSQFNNQVTENIDIEKQLREIQQLLDSQKYDLVLKQAERLLSQVKPKPELYYLIAQSYVETDRLDRGKQECERALKIDPLDIKILFLLVEIETQQHSFRKAKEFLKRIIYLEPSAVSAYFYLGDIYRQEKDLIRANKMYQTTAEIIQSPSEQIIFDPRDKKKKRDFLMALKSRL